MLKVNFKTQAQKSEHNKNVLCSIDKQPGLSSHYNIFNINTEEHAYIPNV